MVVYISLFLYFSLISIFDLLKQRKVTKLFFYLSFVILVVFAGIRFDTGWDYPGYQFYYDKIPSLGNLIEDYEEFDSIYFEPGFKLFMSALKSLGVEFQGLIFIVNFITTSLFFIFIKRTGKFIGCENIMVLLYFSTVFLYTNFSFLRQGMAIGIWLIAINYLSKSMVKYILIVLFACLFHYSVILFLFLPVIIYLKPKGNLLFFFMVFSIFIYVLNIKWLQTISPLLPEFMYSKLSHYFESERFGSTRSLGFGFLEKLVTMSLVIYFYFYKLKDRVVLNNFYPYLIIYLLYFICYMVFFEATIVYDRTRLSFASFSISILPFMVLFFRQFSQLIVVLFIFLYSAFMFNNIISSEQNQTVFIPYNTIFTDESLIPIKQKGRARTELGEHIDHNSGGNGEKN